MTEIGNPQREHEVIPLVEPVPGRDIPAIPEVDDPSPILPERVPEPVEPLVPA